MAYEQPSKDKLVVYIKADVIQTDVDSLEAELQSKPTLISRPLYGLQLSKPVGDMILEMVQMTPTSVMRDYHVFSVWDGTRLYVETRPDGVVVFMVTTHAGHQLSAFRDLTSSL
jgi:hypothetical protein